jgi:hypothetical protein
MTAGLGCLAALVLLVAQSFGLVPDGGAAARRGRPALCEAIARQF